MRVSCTHDEAKAQACTRQSPVPRPLSHSRATGTASHTGPCAAAGCSNAHCALAPRPSLWSLALVVQGVAPDDVACAVFARRLVSVNRETNVRRHPDTRRSDVELAVRKARLAQVDADATQRLALRLIDGCRNGTSEPLPRPASSRTCASQRASSAKMRPRLPSENRSRASSAVLGRRTPFCCMLTAHARGLCVRAGD